jgi:hypothetical protein
MAVITALHCWRGENGEFEASMVLSELQTSLGYEGDPVSNETKQNETETN